MVLKKDLCCGKMYVLPKFHSGGLYVLQRNNTTDYEKNQLFEEIIPEEKVSLFSEKKKATNYLAMVEDKIGYASKAERLEVCATSLVFEKAAEGLHLVFGNFCRVRLCPMCSWRRSLKLQAQMYKIADYLSDDYGYIFVTLTVENCEAPELRAVLNEMQYAWQKFRQLKAIRQINKGFYRGIEVTHDVDEVITPRRYKKAKDYYQRRGLKEGDPNPNYDKYHPHYHVVFAVPKSYFTSRNYLSREKFAEMWKSCMQSDIDLQVKVNAVKPERKGDGTVRGAIREVTKYPMKDTEYLTGDFDYDARTVADLERELHDLRFVSMGGAFRRAHAELNLTDYDDPEADAPENRDASKLVAYVWRTGVTRYDEDAPYVRQYLAYEAARDNARKKQ